MPETSQVNDELKTLEDTLEQREAELRGINIVHKGLLARVDTDEIYHLVGEFTEFIIRLPKFSL